MVILGYRLKSKYILYKHRSISDRYIRNYIAEHRMGVEENIVSLSNVHVIHVNIQIKL